MKKKWIAGMMTAVLAVGMVMPVSAAENQTDDQMTVEYEQVSTYTLHIPASVDLTAEGGNEKVGVSQVNTKPGEKLQVKIKSGINGSSQVELGRENDSNTKVVSLVTDSKGNSMNNGSIVAEFQGMSTTAITTGTAGDGTLNFGAIKDSTGGTVKAGTYTGVIVFEGSMVSNS